MAQHFNGVCIVDHPTVGIRTIAITIGGVTWAGDDFAAEFAKQGAGWLLLFSNRLS